MESGLGLWLWLGLELEFKQGFVDLEDGLGFAVEDAPFESASPYLGFTSGFFCFDFEIDTEYVDVSWKFQLQIFIPVSVSTFFHCMDEKEQCPLLYEEQSLRLCPG